ncbi:MAG: RHS repeat protein [Cyclobacteriaceae bacterium]|nr:RHS repeat protein [Cyclobacteriaceae bacterium]
MAIALSCKDNGASNCQLSRYKLNDLTLVYLYNGEVLIGYRQYIAGVSEPGLIEYHYDSKGNITSEVVKLGYTPYTNTMEYDADGNLTKVTSPSGEATSYSYNSSGQLTVKEDTQGFKTVYSYDNLTTHNPASVVNTYLSNPGQTVSFTYDSKPNPFRKLKPYGSTQPDNNVVSKTSSGSPGETLTYEYNAAGYWTKQTSSIGQITVLEYTCR